MIDYSVAELRVRLAELMRVRGEYERSGAAPDVLSGIDFIIEETAALVERRSRARGVVAPRPQAPADPAARQAAANAGSAATSRP